EEILAGSWLSLDSFIAAIKRLDPDFQRPNGDYSSWYIYDADGESLMGFENWDLVEGALIRYIVTYILLLLGVVDVGLPNQNSAPNSFRITPQGETFLANRLTGKPEKPQKTVFLRVTANFQAYVPQAADLYDRFQLARFATLAQREEERVIYEINQASVGRALRNGVTPDQIVAFLARATNNQTPLKVVETLRLWGARQGTAYLERVTILRLKNAAQVQELQQHPALKPLLGDVLGPATILIPSENTLKVRQLLTELGYLAGSEPN
ncbi:MAG: helicase-associated domain-containing protein, partial [Anaerolineae bacterium]|nr:helicase-associated domain-containing protein [Anaerolineae bacterium]